MFVDIARVLGVLLLAQSSPPAVFVERVDKVPDITQDIAFQDGPDYGDALCAPAAVSNSLLYLADHGYPMLADTNGADRDRHVALVRALAAPEYLNTAPDMGTSKERILSGVRAYVTSRGYRVRSLEYRGIEVYFRPDDPPSDPLRIEWIKSTLVTGASVWLQIGWYRREGADFHKTGGHWVTFTGYGTDAANHKDASMLILRDPSPRAGADPSSEHVAADVVTDGRLHGWGLPQPAAGYADVTRGLHLPADADAALLEGAVALELETP